MGPAARAVGGQKEAISRCSERRCVVSYRRGGGGLRGNDSRNGANAREGRVPMRHGTCGYGNRPIVGPPKGGAGFSCRMPCAGKRRLPRSVTPRGDFGIYPKTWRMLLKREIWFWSMMPLKPNMKRIQLMKIVTGAPGQVSEKTDGMKLVERALSLDCFDLIPIPRRLSILKMSYRKKVELDSLNERVSR